MTSIRKMSCEWDVFENVQLIYQICYQYLTLSRFCVNIILTIENINLPLAKHDRTTFSGFCQLPSFWHLWKSRFLPNINIDHVMSIIYSFLTFNQIITFRANKIALRGLPNFRFVDWFTAGPSHSIFRQLQRLQITLS